MNDYDTWSAWQHADELLRQERALDALKLAELAGTPREALIVLADEAGIGTLYNNGRKA